MVKNTTDSSREATPRAPAIPFHVGVLAALTKEKVKVELLCLLFGLVALASLVSALITGSKGVQIVALDATGRPVKLEKLAHYEYWAAHLQSFVLDFMTMYFDKDPLSASVMTEKALRMMTESLREREGAKAVSEVYQLMQTNTRVLNEVRSMELDPQDRFTWQVMAERTTRSMQKGHEWEKKELVKYRLQLAPEPRAVENQFKGLRVRDFTLEVI